jgi:hypothetical protein
MGAARGQADQVAPADLLWEDADRVATNRLGQLLSAGAPDKVPNTCSDSTTLLRPADLHTVCATSRRCPTSW